MAANWRVVAQQQREELTAQGTFQKVWDVSFEVPSGTRATVTVPERLYSEDYVRDAIEARAQQIIGVESL